MPNDASPSKAWKSVDLQTLPELKEWRSNPSARDLLVQQTQGDLDAFIGKARSLIEQSLPASYGKNSHASSGFLQLKKQGYTRAQLAESFAVAWLLSSQRLYLPRLKSNLANNGWVLHAPPVVLTLALLLKVIFLLVAFSGKETMAFLYASPGFFLIPSIPVYLLIRWLWLKAVPRLFKSGGPLYPNVVHPQRAEAEKALQSLYQSFPTEAEAQYPAFASSSMEPLTMFQQLEPVSAKRHGELYCRPITDYRFAQETTHLPVSPQEVGRLVHHYPLVFTSQGNLELIALMGLQQTNAYCTADGQWRAPVKPKTLEHYPFALAATQQEDQRVLALDPSAPQLNPFEGEALFTAADDYTPWLQQKQEQLVQWNRQCLQARPLLAELEKYQVLTSAPLNVNTRGQTHTLNGLKRVDLEKIKAQEDATLARWARNGLLQLAYLQLASLEHLDQILPGDDASAQELAQELGSQELGSDPN